MIKILYALSLILLTSCAPWSIVGFYNNSVQDNIIIMSDLTEKQLEYYFHIKPNSRNGKLYLSSHVYEIEISLDSQRKACCFMFVETDCTIYIYDNGFIFSTYDDLKSCDLIKKYKVEEVDKKKYIIFNDLNNEEVFFYPFNTSSPDSPIFLYDRNPPFMSLFGK